MQQINLCRGDDFRVSELAACRWPLTVLARVRSRASPCMVFAGQSRSGFFFGVFRFSPVVIIPLVLHTHIHLHDALTSLFP
jgi:hypothetical protein